MPLKVVVQDANILIDLEIAGLFDVYLQLGFETHTSDFIVRQLEDGDHRDALTYIQAEHIRSHSFDEAEMGSVLDLFDEMSDGPDLADCSALYLAGKMGALLLTGDRALRQEAERLRRIEVHGTLWILDLIVLEGLVSGRVAAAKIDVLLAEKRRLPRDECLRCQARWRKKG